MTRKQPKIPAATLRRIERLEAQLAALRDSQDRAWRGYGQTLAQSVEYRTRIEQAVRILTGKDDEEEP